MRRSIIVFNSVEFFVFDASRKFFFFSVKNTYITSQRYQYSDTSLIDSTFTFIKLRSNNLAFGLTQEKSLLKSK